MNTKNNVTRDKAEKAAPIILKRKRISKTLAGLGKVTVFYSKGPVINNLCWKCSPVTGGIFPDGTFFCFTLPGKVAAALQLRQPGR